MRVRPRETGQRGAFAPVLVLSVSLAVIAFLVLMSAVLLVELPHNASLGAAAAYANQQNQNAKTTLYLLSFFVLLPLAILAAPRLADRIAALQGSRGLSVLAWAVASLTCGMLVSVRVSSGLPWGDGVGVVLAVFGAGALLIAGVLGRAVRARPWPLLERMSPHEARLAAAAAGLAFAAVLCVTHVGSSSTAPLLIGLVLVAAGLVLALRPRRGPPGHPRRSARSRRLLGGIDLVALVLILLAVPDVVIYKSLAALPNAFFPPGVFQFQQDWIIGPANQLFHGGAVMVNDPVSQYGVGMLYFLAGWFHIAPIGYGTFGLLDGILTALVYVSGYCVLRMAGARSWLAMATLGVAVVALIYSLHYPVGALPEQGPLRFGMPMAFLLVRVGAGRWPRFATAGRALSLLVLAVAAVWALEAFAYTAATYLACAALAASLRPEGERRAALVRELGLGVGAIVLGHAAFALATLAGSGHLPAWREYLSYIHSLLFGGKEGSITYGFARWSPGLAMGAAAAASLAGVVLLVRRAGAFAREHSLTALAIAGMSVYELAVFSYTDSRAATYLLPYVALPLLLSGALWLALLGQAGQRVPRAVQAGTRAFAAGIAVVLIAAAWPVVGAHFSDSALAKAYPGGGLRAAVRRLWHSPPIDPRAPRGQAILARYFPGERAIVLLPDAQDLSIEMLMRAKKANRLYIGDPVMDDFIPQIWMPKIQAQINGLRPGENVLTQPSALALLASIRRTGRPFDPRQHETGSAIPTGVYNAPELVWSLQQIEARYRVRQVYSDAQGFLVLSIVARR